MHTIRCSNTPRRTWHTALLCVCLAASLWTIPATAQAAREKKASESVPGGPAKKKGAIKVKHQKSPSEESTAERDRRLYRECKGLPNAGACLGYARR